jgi:serine/threonine protein kinase
MPAPVTPIDLLDLLRKSQLLDAAKLDAYLQSAGDLPSDPAALANRLVADGIITKFQASQLLKGRYKGFTIGRYKVLEVIGTGGMGNVYLGEHLAMRHRVALKVLPAEKAKDAEFVAQFTREARSAATVQHPNLVRTIDIDSIGEMHYLVMEYVDGVNLADYVRRHGRLSAAEAAHYAAQAAAGLEYLHQGGMVHRDIKPGNFMIDRQGTVKILDFGLARFTADDQEALAQDFDESRVLGTADFVAPEQALRGYQADIRSDLYSLGATLYYLLAGRPPFPGSSIPQKLLFHQIREPEPLEKLRPDLPGELVAIVRKLMAKKPEERYQTPTEVIEALLPWTETVIPPPREEFFPSLSKAALAGMSGRFAAPVTPSGRMMPPSGILRLRSSGLSSTNLSAPPVGGPREAPETAPMNVLPTLADTPMVSTSMRAILDPAPAPASPRPAGVGPRIMVGVVVGCGVLMVVLALGWWLIYGQGKTDAGDRGRIQAEAGDTKGQPPSEVQPTKAGREGGAAPTRKVTPRGRPPAEAVVVAPSGRDGALKTLRAALTKARPGDRIVVTEPIAEHLDLDGGLGEGVTIEAWPTGDRPVTWSPPGVGPAAQPLIRVVGVANLRIVGFHLDGEHRVAELIRLVGECSGVHLEDLSGAGFSHAGVLLRNCTSRHADQPVTLTRVQLDARVPTPAAVWMEAPVSANAVTGQRHVRLDACRFVGEFVAGLYIAGPTEAIEVRGCRFSGMKAAVVIEAANPPVPLDLTVRGSTFHEVRRGLLFAGRPPRDARLVVENNLFLKTDRLAAIEGVETEVEYSPAQWIWHAETGSNPNVPAEPRYFRKRFEAPNPLPNTVILHISADEAFEVWLNGEKVGQSNRPYFDQWIHAIDVTRFIKPGPNVLAVKVVNAADPVQTKVQTPAGLLVHVGDPRQMAAPLAVSDASWKSTTQPPARWQDPSTDDRSWPAARPWTQPNIAWPWKHAVWEWAVRQAVPEPPAIRAESNLRDYESWEGFPNLGARRGLVAEGDVGHQKLDDAGFLRYSRQHPLFQMGRDGQPIGVPREP